VLLLMFWMTGRADALSPSNAPASAPAAPPGVILESKRAEPDSTSYEQYISFQEKQYPQDAMSSRLLGVTPPTLDKLRSAALTSEQYEQRLHDGRFECLRIIYRSDGLKVAGYLFKPVNTQGKTLPLIIYNRGGQGDLGTVGPVTMLQLHPFLANGFVVLASQYRGCDGGEGKDEFGGADVRDVLNLVPVAHSLDYIDMNNVFMYGVSRGGMETYVAIKQGMRVNAAAVEGAPADEVSGNKRRPQTDVYESLVPGFKQNPEAAFRERSAVYWTEKLDTPLLLLHGGADWRVSPRQSLALATRLQEMDKPYQIFIYAGDDHALSLHRDERDRQIIDWFRSHMR
jgi:dipeptidyl aminopeptidase/acylaminoacyl peptidase